MADAAGVPIEIQRLHGMGEALYAGADERYGDVTLRAYAPVGGHEDLLPYLVRRLLENGANTSFVHALLDETHPGRGGGAPIRSRWSRRSPARPPAHPAARATSTAPARRNSHGRDFCHAPRERDAARRRRRRLDAEARRRARSSAAS